MRLLFLRCRFRKRLAPVFLLRSDQLISHVVLVDVRDVIDGLLADSVGGDELYVIQPHIWVEALLRGFCPKSLHAGRPAIVGSEREQNLIQLVDLLNPLQCIHRGIEVLDAGMNVGFFLCDVSDVHFFASRRHQLHHTDCANLTLSLLIQA